MFSLYFIFNRHTRKREDAFFSSGGQARYGIIRESEMIYNHTKIA